jgi:hypothetical protein
LVASLLAAAEEYEHKLERQIGLFSSRLDDMLSRLGDFQAYLGQELGPDEVAEDVNDVVAIEKGKQDEVKDEMRGAAKESSSADDSALELQAAAGLPGAVLDPNEEAEAVGHS